MTLLSKVEPAGARIPLPKEPFDDAVQRVNEWRGRCIDAFTRAEMAVTDCLVAVVGTDRGKKIKLPHLVGQRFAALTAAVVPGGPFEVEGRLALPPLKAFEELNVVRTFLCHGVADVTLGRQCRWTAVLHIVSLSPKGRTEDTRVFREDSAAHLQRQIVDLSKQLCSRLTVFRATLAQH